MAVKTRVCAIVVIINIITLFPGCKKVYFSQFVNMSNCEWNLNDTCRFNLPVLDTAASYDFLLFIRHTNDYPFQNLWLELSMLAADSTLHVDTMEIYLANNRGQWLGTKKNTLVQMPVLLRSQPQITNLSSISVRHLMRDTILYGIYDVGMKIEEAKKQN